MWAFLVILTYLVDGRQRVDYEVGCLNNNGQQQGICLVHTFCSTGNYSYFMIDSNYSRNPLHPAYNPV